MLAKIFKEGEIINFRGHKFTIEELLDLGLLFWPSEHKLSSIEWGLGKCDNHDYVDYGFYDESYRMKIELTKPYDASFLFDRLGHAITMDKVSFNNYGTKEDTFYEVSKMIQSIVNESYARAAENEGAVHTRC